MYRCDVCKTLVCVLEGAGDTLTCCGQKMQKLEPNTKEASNESHVPVIERNENEIVVRVGEKDHPMTEKHYIKWIALLTDRGICTEELHPEDKPEATFCICENEVIRGVYSYCNIHGLWKGCIS